MSGLTIRVKRGSRGSATLLEAANRILRLLGVSSTKRGKQPSPKSKKNGRSANEVKAPIAAVECVIDSPIKMQASPAASVPAPAPATSPAASQSLKPAKRTAKDYIFGKLIGDGMFSTVFRAKDIHTGKEYAIKVCEKLHIIRKKKREYIKREKDALNMLFNVPHGFVKLYCTFQDEERLYFVLSYAKNGELLAKINEVGSFDINVAKHYAAELLLALEKMHGKGIIHRDLKPENILLDENMHLRIADFGTAKIMDPEEIRTAQPVQEDNENDERSRKISFVGTPQYVSPELLHNCVDTRTSDLWAFGCIIYQMISGLPPFRAATEFLIFQKILKLEYDFPEGFPADAKDLVEKLLVLDHSKRIGADDTGDTYQSIRNHPFFAGIDWENILDQTPPTISPYLPGGSFEEEYNIPDHLEPGLDNKQLLRLWEFDLNTSKGILDISPDEKRRRLEIQARENKWHQFVDGELILKQGQVDKRKGLFPRRRMLLLTTGPRLFYVDPVNMVLKGEIPWSPELRVEAKNFRIFLVHTPNRTYYLEDPDSYALEWTRVIDEVRIATYVRDTT
ncbi:3-phosphoinositide-dependent protein kinase 1 isoform X1 [Amyelois transitella]|uniref:3-phosphoinositide-dependent protein kinase 1 isoform X1 n=2 Tax=Amyelois transitella TaxID=680683 RepID=UPI00067B2B91|nr:3-phosphoinositide-dependent protein kinase 1 isoform X1 [Amyelois transitella]